MSFASVIAVLVAAPVLLTAAAAAPSPGPAKSAPAQWKARAAALIADLAAGRYGAVEAASTPEVRSALPAAALAQTWETVLGQVGEFSKIVSAAYDMPDGYHRVVSDCAFAHMDIDITTAFDSDGRLAGLFLSPHAPAAESQTVPTGIVEHSVTVGAGGKWPLPGTLTLPDGPGPFPAVVLVHGSGPEDRDETIGANKPFRDLAWGLAARGIAVLRYDKRTLVYRTQLMRDIKAFTVDAETVDDACAAADLLRGEKSVNPRRIFVLGHSLGAMLIPRIAKRTAFAAGYIVMAGPAEPLEDVLVRQLQARMPAHPTKAQRDELIGLRRQVALVASSKLTQATPATDLPLGLPADYWLSIRGIQAPVEAEQIRQPMLILQGGEDRQVTPSDLAIWRKDLAGKANVDFELYPGLSHLFMSGQPDVTDYYAHPGHVAPTVVGDIAKFVGDCPAVKQ